MLEILLLERQLGLRNKEAIKSEERKRSIIYYLEAFPGDGIKRSMYTDISRFTEKIVVAYLKNPAYIILKKKLNCIRSYTQNQYCGKGKNYKDRKHISSCQELEE